MPIDKDNEIVTLKSKIESNDPHALSAVNRLIELDKEIAVDYLITLLDSTKPALRSLSALGLHDLADSRALEPLFQAITKPENTNSNGTLVFALGGLDCSSKFSEIFDLLFYGTYEVKVEATAILEEQTFEFRKADLRMIQNKWNEIQANPDLCPYYDNYKENIHDLVSSYLYYLDK
ncbi:HEAT repeat domain-containing protein [Mucilaginibacter agri]|uniref:HEAT repeat domain-containing protein n=1 Tax=Mucilaginibacter agri TaxID=2695265 RepID=A0A966DSR5_9SPHI|nr:hypothetical protein [Mucilaginibacter agri]NCD68512.1 hypothetical protein [Mucilaginibacter agri]